jgi:hypothetical protein
VEHIGVTLGQVFDIARFEKISTERAARRLAHERVRPAQDLVS